MLSAWREAKNWFSKEEQVILRLTGEITLIPNHGLSDQTYDEAITLFGEELTAKLIVAVININALNRIAVFPGYASLTAEILNSPDSRYSAESC